MLKISCWGSIHFYLKICEQLKYEDLFNENYNLPYEGSVGNVESSFDKSDEDFEQCLQFFFTFLSNFCEKFTFEKSIPWNAPLDT